MKRLAALVLAALMILGMTACGQKKDESKSKLDQIKEAGVLVVARRRTILRLSSTRRLTDRIRLSVSTSRSASTSPISWAYS